MFLCFGKQYSVEYFIVHEQWLKHVMNILTLKIIYLRLLNFGAFHALFYATETVYIKHIDAIRSVIKMQTMLKRVANQTFQLSQHSNLHSRYILGI